MRDAPLRSCRRWPKWGEAFYWAAGESVPVARLPLSDGALAEEAHDARADSLHASTRAKIFEKVGKQTEMFARFTTVAGERGAADAERDIRGFALKFYTEEGNWDMVGNNTPVFFIRDPRQFPDLNKAVKRDPKTNMRSATNNWDYWTLLPEALHQITIVMSERGIPASYRHMHGFGSHTYSFWNAAGERFWVKFHFKTQQGIKNLTDAEAEALIGKDRESHQRDLFDAIARGAGAALP